MRKTFRVLSLLPIILAVAAAVRSDHDVPDYLIEENILDALQIDSYLSGNVGGDFHNHDVITLNPSVRQASVDTSGEETEVLTRRPEGGNEDVNTDKSNAGQRPVKNPPLCKCRALKRSKNAVCYDMLVPLKPYGRCKKRRCGTQYECVPGGGSGLKNCLRQVATHEVKLRRNERGTLLCNTYKLLQPTVFYTLYT